MFLVLVQGWEIWGNTELLLDVCRRNDTLFMATGGGLLLSDGETVLKSYTKTEGLKTAQAVSVACEPNGVWVLTPKGLQVWNGRDFTDVNLIVFGDPNEILGARTILYSHGYIFIVGKSRPTALRVSDTVEIPFPFEIGQTNVLKVFGDTLVIGGDYGAMFSIIDSFYVYEGWHTLLSGFTVYDVDTFRGGWVFATDSGVRDTSGRVSFGERKVLHIYSTGDTLWVADDGGLYVLDSLGGDTVKVGGLYVRFLGEGLVGFGNRLDPAYMIGNGIYTLPDFRKIPTGGLSFTSITGMVEIGDSLLLCGKGGMRSCAFWPSGEHFQMGLINTVKFYQDRIWIAYHNWAGLALFVYAADFSDTVVFKDTALLGFGYVFDVAEFQGKVYAVSWNANGDSRLFEVNAEEERVTATDVRGAAQNLLYSTGEHLLICSQVACKFYDGNLQEVASVPFGGNAAHHRGDTLFLGSDNGFYKLSLKDFSYSGPFLTGRKITGIWVGIDGKIWVADQTGITVLNRDLSVYRNYTPSNSPLPGVPVSVSVYFPIRFSLLANPQKNRMYIATDGGLAVYTDPEIVSGWQDSSLVYPNPVKAGKHINLKNCPIDARLTLYTISGVKLKEERSCRIKAPDRAGLFILNVSSGGIRKNYKVVVVE